MEKNANIFLSQQEAEDFVQEVASMAPGALLGKDEEGNTLYFLYVEFVMPIGALVIALTVGESDYKYEGRNIFKTGITQMSLSKTASLMGRGLDVNSEDIK